MYRRDVPHVALFFHYYCQSKRALLPLSLCLLASYSQVGVAEVLLEIRFEE